MLCLCGCGVETKGGRFLLGHHMRLPENKKRLSENNPLKNPELAKMASERMKGDSNPLRRMPESNPMKNEATAKKQGEKMRGHNNPMAGKFGPEHPNFKNVDGGYRGPVKEHRAAVQEALRLASYMCSKCFTGFDLMAHHKVAPTDGVSWDNSQANLVVMCRRCHTKETWALGQLPAKNKKCGNANKETSK